MSEITATIKSSRPIAATVVTAQPIMVTFTRSGPPGKQGPPGSLAVEENFAWGDATPAILTVVDAGGIVYSISLVILVPFDGVGAALSIGVPGAPELFMAVVECDPKAPGVYTVNPGYRFTAAGVTNLFITPGAGASQGNGVVVMTKS